MSAHGARHSGIQVSLFICQCICHAMSGVDLAYVLALRHSRFRCYLGARTILESQVASPRLCLRIRRAKPGPDTADAAIRTGGRRRTCLWYHALYGPTLLLCEVRS
eukprot:3937208-Rhodomonas_salina.4